MTRQEKHLIWFLRFSAVMFLAAAPAVFMPTAWMRAVNDLYGLAALPELPLMEYLSRHLSAFYACMGASYWYISRDVRRFMPLIRFTAPLTFVQGLIVVGIDIAAGMPLMWTIGEGVSMGGWTLALWWLVRRVDRLMHGHGCCDESKEPRTK